jgi:ubiquinone/menaquinone biosynthesis C-methylase UbiE
VIRNQQLYRLADVAAVYARESTLFAPEETILRLLSPELRSARMLDLGVGGGRTTMHFARRVREYVGADYSDTMIRACRERFAAYPNSLSFVECDARSLQMFANGSFDFVLFSCNGIDSVNHADRLTILKEVSRVGKPGGWFCFSSHNLNSGTRLFASGPTGTRPPSVAKRTLKRWLWRFVYNWRVRPTALQHSPHVMISEPAHSRRVTTYYVRPEEQLNQLRAHFADIRVFSFANGSEIVTEDELRMASDICLYYLCRIGCE